MRWTAAARPPPCSTLPCICCTTSAVLLNPLCLQGFRAPFLMHNPEQRKILQQNGGNHSHAALGGAVQLHMPPNGCRPPVVGPAVGPTLCGKALTF